jgi:hypothetical protein
MTTTRHVVSTARDNRQDHTDPAAADDTPAADDPVPVADLVEEAIENGVVDCDPDAADLAVPPHPTALPPTGTNRPQRERPRQMIARARRIQPDTASLLGSEVTRSRAPGAEPQALGAASTSTVWRCCLDYRTAWSAVTHDAERADPRNDRQRHTR